MKQIFYVTLLGFGILHSDFSLHAQPTSTYANPKAKADNSAKEQKQEAAWVMESAQVAKEYVDGLDKGHYDQSWTKGDQIFQNTISQKEWMNALNITRKNLGKAKARSLRDQRIAWNPRGLPEGAYMVVEFDTTFENSSGPAIELLTLRRGPDKKWRVLTYQVLKNK